jgi:hypothetical protein
MSDLFKKASKKKLRFSTSKGSLSAEQLWDLTISELDSLAVAQEDKVEESPNRSFVFERSAANVDEKLRFDILFDILQTKVKSQEAASQAANTRATNQKIINLIAEKKDDVLKGKTLEELEQMIS